MSESLGDRMKVNYEKRFEYKLLRRIPVIIRLDGRSFHTLTNKCEKPFDLFLSQCMGNTAKYLCEEIQGAKCAYTQSDEISILLTDYDLITTQAWFDYDLQKVVSISASLASVYFSKLFEADAQFDSRAFNLPVDEVANYFIWRQKDWIRNSVAMLAQSHFSANQLLNKEQSDMHEMLHQKDINWAELLDRFKNGVFVFKTQEAGIATRDNAIFTEDRFIVEMFLSRKD